MKMPTSPTGNSGMTLVELTMVLAIIAVLAGLIVPRLSAHAGGAALREAANGLLHAARYARHHALTRGQACRLVIETRENRYRLETRSQDAGDRQGFKALRSGPIRATSLPAPVHFDGVRINPRTRIPGNSYVITFEPTSEADAAVIRISDGGRTYSLLVMPGTGRTELVDRAVDRLPNDREDLDD